MTESLWKNLHTFSLWWSAKHLDKFPHWTRGDVAHEVIVGYFSIAHRYDPERGSLNTFLNASIWDVVFRSYAKQRDIEITRPGQKRGKPMPKRSYKDRLSFVQNYPETLKTDDDDVDVQLPDLPDGYDDITDLIQRGLTQRQIGFCLGVTESRISQRMRELRKDARNETRRTS